MGDLFRARMFAALPLLWLRTIAAFKRAFRPDCKNVIYYYGPLFFDGIVPLHYAQQLGYKIVFDVIEDYNLGKAMSRSPYDAVRYYLTMLISRKIETLSAGIIVISSCLEEKYRTLDRQGVPIHYMPISVNMNHFLEKRRLFDSTVSLFYAGSFARKDGLPVLLDAFDTLAAKYGNLHLVLTGKGDKESMRRFFARRDASPYKERINYKGYLNEKEYYELLNNIDIPCMTRIDLAYAHAGFPFKLGEFLATGQPVIASRVSDIDRFLVHGQNAVVVPPGASKALCEAAEFLMLNPESAARIGERGREVAESFFEYKKQGRALLSFLKNI